MIYLILIQVFQMLHKVQNRTHLQTNSNKMDIKVVVDKILEIILSVALNHKKDLKLPNIWMYNNFVIRKLIKKINLINNNMINRIKNLPTKINNFIYKKYSDK